MRFVPTVTDRGVVSLPAKLRKMFGLKGSGQLIAETTPEGILLKPCVILPIELYSPERIQEFDKGAAEVAEVLKRKGIA